MRGVFITLEGTEGSGKSTQLPLLAERLVRLGHKVRTLREPGGTPLGEELRIILKHSQAGAGMTAEAELLLMNACRAQLVREVIRPALAAGEIVLCDRFYDSTTAYQAYGRQLDKRAVASIVQFATGGLEPDLTLVLRVPVELSEARRALRTAQPERDRMEEADREFFRRVEQGYEAVIASSDDRVVAIDATRSVAEVSEEIWRWAAPAVDRPSGQGDVANKSVGEWKPPAEASPHGPDF